MRIELPLHIVSEANQRCHWSTKARRAKAHRRAAVAIPKGDYLPCAVTLIRVAPRGLDGDNLQSGFKALRDGIADRLGINDNDPRVTWHYAQIKRGKGEYGVVIDIKPENS